MISTLGGARLTPIRAFKDLFKGVSVNVNLVSDDRRTFQLGMAIGHRYVIMDDVSCVGMKNLDRSLRDYLDGHHEVILVSKNKDPVG